MPVPFCNQIRINEKNIGIRTYENEYYEISAADFVAIHLQYTEKWTLAFH